MKRLIFFILLFPLTLTAQTGGENAFPFIDLPYNARATSLGRTFITAYDDDINIGAQNPAAFNTKMSNSIGVNQTRNRRTSSAVFCLRKDGQNR